MKLSSKTKINLTAGTSGAFLGGRIGSTMGLAMGPMGAVVGTIPGTVIGGLIGFLRELLHYDRTGKEKSEF